MSKYVPPHRRIPLRLQNPSDNSYEYSSSPITPSAYSASRWAGERPTSSGGSSATGRPASQASLSVSSPGHQKLLQAYGDSFVGPLMQLDRVVDVHRFSGATAKGLSNERSMQQVGRRIVEHLDKTRPEKVLLQFGNVDINISSIYQLEKITDPAAVAEWKPRTFVTDVLAGYEAFLRRHIFKRLERPPGSSPLFPDDPPAYIRHLYLCEATLPVVEDDALPESHAKYQFPKKGREGQPERSAEQEEELERQAEERIRRVRPLVPRCGMKVRRDMTAQFNNRLLELAADVNNRLLELAEEDNRERGAPASLAEVHLVNLNQYIQEDPLSSKVAAPYVTTDPTNLHLVWETTLPFWIKELESAGLRTYDMPTQRELDEKAAEYVAKKEGQMAIMKQKRNSS